MPIDCFISWTEEIVTVLPLFLPSPLLALSLDFFHHFVLEFEPGPNIVPLHKLSHLPFLYLLYLMQSHITNWPLLSDSCLGVWFDWLSTWQDVEWPLSMSVCKLPCWWSWEDSPSVWWQHPMGWDLGLTKRQRLSSLSALAVGAVWQQLLLLPRPSPPSWTTPSNCETKTLAPSARWFSQAFCQSGENSS